MVRSRRGFTGLQKLAEQLRTGREWESSSDLARGAANIKKTLWIVHSMQNMGGSFNKKVGLYGKKHHVNVKHQTKSRVLPL